MSHLFTKGCEYGIQATLFIAAQDGRRVGIREVADALTIPTHFLAKILQSLSEQGILDSFKGASGGFTLAAPPDRVNLLQIVAAIDGLEIFNRCILGFAGCGSSKPCPVHAEWGRVRDDLKAILSKDTIADLLSGTKDKIEDILGAHLPSPLKSDRKEHLREKRTHAKS